MVDFDALTRAGLQRWQNAKLTHERLLQVLKYEPETGRFIRKERTSNVIKVGQEAGWVNRNGYRYIEVCGERFLAQRLAWFYMTGAWPSAEIDHKDCDRDNNRWCNLREASTLQNKQNCRMKAINTTGYKGVTFDKRYGKYAARIRANHRRLSLGYFDTPEAAHKAYAAKAAELHGAFARVA